jgi:hypothetical protein
MNHKWTVQKAWYARFGTTGIVGTTDTVRRVIHGEQPRIDWVLNFVVIVSTLRGSIEA